MKQDDQEILDAKKDFQKDLKILKKDYEELINKFKVSVAKNKTNKLWESKE